MREFSNEEKYLVFEDLEKVIEDNNYDCITKCICNYINKNFTTIKDINNLIIKLKGEK